MCFVGSELSYNGSAGGVISCTKKMGQGSGRGLRQSRMMEWDGMEWALFFTGHSALEVIVSFFRMLIEWGSTHD